MDMGRLLKLMLFRKEGIYIEICGLCYRSPDGYSSCGTRLR